MALAFAFQLDVFSTHSFPDAYNINHAPIPKLRFLTPFQSKEVTHVMTMQHHKHHHQSSPLSGDPGDSLLRRSMSQSHVNNNLSIGGGRPSQDLLGLSLASSNSPKSNVKSPKSKTAGLDGSISQEDMLNDSNSSAANSSVNQGMPKSSMSPTASPKCRKDNRSLTRFLLQKWAISSPETSSQKTHNPLFQLSSDPAVCKESRLAILWSPYLDLHRDMAPLLWTRWPVQRSIDGENHPVPYLQVWYPNRNWV